MTDQTQTKQRAYGPADYGLTKAAYPVSEAREHAGLSHSRFYEKVKAGEIKMVKDGARSFVQTPDLVDYLNRRAAALSVAA